MSGMFMRFPGGKAKVLTLSYDDGIEQDIRLMEIMDQHGLKGTFNLNSGRFAPEGTVYPVGEFHRKMTVRQVTEAYADSGHEVAVHGLQPSCHGREVYGTEGIFYVYGAEKRINLCLQLCGMRQM